MIIVDSVLNTLNDDQLMNHKLEAHCYLNRKNKKYKENWHEQFNRNHCVINELKDLGAKIKKLNLDICLLKGYSLIGDIYEDVGERFASDVDWLIEQKDLVQIKGLLLDSGYEEKLEKKWKANNYKYLFYKKIKNIEIVIEVQTHLFWHIENRSRHFKKEVQFGFYKILSSEEQLLHLCGHLAFQHNFLKLFWLLDIQLFLNKYASNLNWDLFWRLAKKDRLKLSSFCCLICVEPQLKIWQAHQVLNDGLSTRLRLRSLKLLINRAYLINPKGHFLRYILIKILIKDKGRDSISYCYHWIIKAFKAEL
jgi:hypothetical protein